MAGLREIAKSIRAYGVTKESSNPVREFAWVLSQVVKGDIVQAQEAQNKDRLGLNLYARSLLYAQRMIEIGYIFTEVFIRDEYKNLQPKTKSPRIIDLGGDPGAFSAIYWKNKVPNARISIVEANPATANTMIQSLERKGIQDVQVINAAIAGDEIGCVSLHLHQPGHGWHTQDFIGNKGIISDGSGYSIEVPKIKLSSLINEGEEIDLLKIDIEGSEREAIRELYESGKLGQVKQIIMEFHHGPVDFPNNSLAEMIEILHSTGFEINDAHKTSGKGLRSKKQVTLVDLENIARSNQKVYLTITASRKN